MKRVCTWGVLLVLWVAAVDASWAVSVLPGPSRLPSWAPEAQVALGWVFGDPVAPQTAEPAALLDEVRYVGPSAPTWDYQAQRTYHGQAAQWYVHVPNVLDLNPVKHIWISYTVRLDPAAADDASFLNLNWSPNEGYGNLVYSEEWFDAAGAPLDSFNPANAALAAYSRVTMNRDLYPNPQFEDIWIGAAPGCEILEVYLLTQCDPDSPLVPEPLTALATLTGLGALARYSRRRRRD